MVRRSALRGRAAEAGDIAHHQLAVIDAHWNDACDEACLTAVERDAYRRVFPSPFALQGD